MQRPRKEKGFKVIDTMLYIIENPIILFPPDGPHKTKQHCHSAFHKQLHLRCPSIPFQQKCPNTFFKFFIASKKKKKNTCTLTNTNHQKRLY
jgi:hypothetical protein